MKKKLIIIFVVVVNIVVPPVTAAVSGTNMDRISLREPIPLKLRYSVGETLYYRLLRHSDLFQMDGSKFGEHKAVAYYTRTRLENDSLGRVTERFTWKRFGFGQSLTPDKPAEISYLEEAKNFSLVCSVQDEDILSKFDFSGLPRTIVGMWFMIMSWDAITFDGPVRPQKYFSFPDSAQIGTEVKSTRGAHDFEFDFSPILTDSRYTFSGKGCSKVMGVCMVKDTPCAIIEFSDSENVILMNVDLAQVKVKSRGFEHFWGKTYLSLEDGSILKGELLAPVANIQDIQMPGQEEPSHTEYFILQRLELEMLSPEEFEREVAIEAE